VQKIAEGEAGKARMLAGGYPKQKIAESEAGRLPFVSEKSSGNMAFYFVRPCQARLLDYP